MAPQARYRLVLGDARRMRRAEDSSVHLVVTSPPYWQLKDYGSAAQIGFHQTYEEYLAELEKVWSECLRVLHPGCRLAVNIGDQFARATIYGRYRVIPIHADVITSCVRLGFDFMGAIIWQKVTTCNTSGGGTVMGSFPYPRNGIVKLDYEYILLFKKPGRGPRPDPEAKEAARLETEEWNRLFYGHWQFPGARQEEHIAVFPEELPSRLIRMFTFPGEHVLDPFLGSGTTMKAARGLGRSCTGYEINEEYLPLILEKTGFGAERAGNGEAALEVIREAEDLETARRDREARKAAEELAARARGYGSVVRRGDSRSREEFFRVREVLAVNRVRLDDGRAVRLVGILPNERSVCEGIRRLEELVRGRRVYLRSDPLRSPDEIYLHLENRTSVNSRLIREGLADAEPAPPYRLRKRYLRYQAERAGSSR